MSWPALTPNEQAAGFRPAGAAVRVPGAPAGSRLVALVDDVPGPSRARLAQLIRQVRLLVLVIGLAQIAGVVALVMHTLNLH